jgi:hypothetical protein
MTKCGTHKAWPDESTATSTASWIAIRLERTSSEEHAVVNIDHNDTNSAIEVWIWRPPQLSRFGLGVCCQFARGIITCTRQTPNFGTYNWILAWKTKNNADKDRQPCTNSKAACSHARAIMAHRSLKPGTIGKLKTGCITATVSHPDVWSNRRSANWRQGTRQPRWPYRYLTYQWVIQGKMRHAAVRRHDSKEDPDYNSILMIVWINRSLNDQTLCT